MCVPVSWTLTYTLQPSYTHKKMHTAAAAIPNPGLSHLVCTYNLHLHIYILCTYDADFYVKHCKTAMIFFPTKLLRPVASQQPFQLPRQQLPGSQQQQQLKASEPQGATDLQRSAFRAHEMPEIPEVSGWKHMKSMDLNWALNGDFTINRWRFNGI